MDWACSLESQAAKPISSLRLVHLPDRKPGGQPYFSFLLPHHNILPSVSGVVRSLSTTHFIILSPTPTYQSLFIQHCLVRFSLSRGHLAMNCEYFLLFS